MKSLNDLPATAAAIRDFLAIPECAENVRERFFRDARRLGMSEFDADDGAQFAVTMMLACPDTLPDGAPCGPVRAFYRTRKWCRRTMYRGANGYKRDRRRRMLAPMAEMTAAANMRAGMMSDNPATIAAALETAGQRIGRAMGRDARAVRALTPDDVRALVMPDMRGLAEREPGEAPRVVESIPGAGKPDMAPRPATPGDGTEWRGTDSEWSLVPPGEGYVSQARHWRRLVG